MGVVGCKVSLINEESGPSGPKEVYIAAMAVLPAYRDLGIGTSAAKQPSARFTSSNAFCTAGSAAIAHVLSNIKGHSEISRVYLHVQHGNDDAVRFYERAGFKSEGTVEGYFPALTPSDAYMMSLSIEH